VHALNIFDFSIPNLTRTFELIDAIIWSFLLNTVMVIQEKLEHVRIMLRSFFLVLLIWVLIVTICKIYI
jgi:hypothetical protein